MFSTSSESNNVSMINNEKKKGLLMIWFYATLVRSL